MVTQQTIPFEAPKPRRRIRRSGAESRYTEALTYLRLSLTLTDFVPVNPQEIARTFKITSGFMHVLVSMGAPMGAIVGTVEVVGTMKTQDWLFQATELLSDEGLDQNALEYAFGDYSFDRFAWQTKNPIQIVNPIPAKGKQGFWNYDLNLLPAIP